ncbi:MAG TPA: hypothetical protein VFY59_08795 [Rubrobacter sp.]|nr:hypothetical protein [Rubrobacter sp.]
MADRQTRERKLVALMVNDLGPGFGEQEMAGLEQDVRSLPDEKLRDTLVTRLDLPNSVDDETLEETLLHVEEPEGISGHDFTRAPDMSHEPRPEERRD